MELLYILLVILVVTGTFGELAVRIKQPALVCRDSSRHHRHHRHPRRCQVLLDIGMLGSRVGKIIVSAAIFDDVFGLVLLAILTALLKTGELPDAWGVFLLVGRIILYFGITAAFGIWILPFTARKLKKLWIEELEFSMLLIVALVFSVTA